MSRDELKDAVVAGLDRLEDWQLQAMARLAGPLDPAASYGNPSALLSLGRYRFEGEGAVGQLVVGEVEIEEVHLNPVGIAHGMVPFAIVDNAMGQVTAGAAGKACVAVEVKIQYLKGLKPGKVRVQAECVKAGRNLCYAESRITNADGEICDVATGTYYLIGPVPFPIPDGDRQ